MLNAAGEGFEATHVICSARFRGTRGAGTETCTAKFAWASCARSHAADADLKPRCFGTNPGRTSCLWSLLGPSSATFSWGAQGSEGRLGAGSLAGAESPAQLHHWGFGAPSHRPWTRGVEISLAKESIPGSFKVGPTSLKRLAAERGPLKPAQKCDCESYE